MENLQLFNYEKHEVRTLVIDSEPWFVGKDVAEVLGYEDTKKAIKSHVEEEDRWGGKTDTPYIIDSLGRKQYPTFINESGLYSLILSSKLPSAKKFKRWVTSEVLPALRKTGSYSIQPTVPKTYKEALIAQQKVLAELIVQVEKNEKLELENEEMKPKALYHDLILNCKDLVSISVIAKDYGMSATKLNTYLHNKGIQFKQGKTWLLYKDYANEGYASSKTHNYCGDDGMPHATVHTYWTQKGRRFIYDLLKADGIVPTIERGE